MDGNFIITGGAMGFGKEFSRRVLESCGRVVLADKNIEKGEETCQDFQQVILLLLPEVKQIISFKNWKSSSMKIENSF